MKNPAFLTAAVILLGCSAASANSIIVAENFGGLSSVALNTTTADTFAPAIVAAGGSANWTSGSSLFRADGSVTSSTSGRSIHLSLGSYINDARGTPEGLFELSVTISETTFELLSVGFSTRATPAWDASFRGPNTLGIATMTYLNSGKIEQYAGPRGDNEVEQSDTTYEGARRLTITLDLRDWDGVENYGTVRFGADVGIDGAYQEFGSFNYTSSNEFNSILLSHVRASGTYSNLTLKQISPSTDPPLLTITPAIAPETGYDLEWDSQVGKAYNLRTSTDLDGPISTWDILEGDIAATPPVNRVNVPADGPRRFYAVEEFEAPPIFTTDFEADNGDFTVVDHSGGTGSVWQWGDPDSSGDGGSVLTGNDDSTNCWGTDIGNPGIYATGTDTSLISPVIDLSEVPNALLSFAEAIDIMPGDTFLVNVIDDDISEGITVLQAAVHTSTPDPDITSADWKPVSNIAITGGRPVRIEWRFTGNNDGSYLGAYIDDVEVKAAP